MARTLDNRKKVERKIEKKKLTKKTGKVGKSRDKNQKAQKNNVVKTVTR